MSKPTLVILAAGLASRYGSAKQVDGFGPSGERIIDYSIYDAIRAGFGKVVFVIREEYLQTMKDLFEEKLDGKINIISDQKKEESMLYYPLQKMIPTLLPFVECHQETSSTDER